MPPGMVAFRKTTIPGGQAKEVREALGLEAGASLLYELDEGYQEISTGLIGESMIGLMAWVPGNLLDQRRHEAEERGFSIQKIFVPELSMPGPQPQILLYVRDGSWGIYYIVDRRPLLCQVSPSSGLSIPLSFRMIMEQAASLGYPDPERIIFWTEGDGGERIGRALAKFLTPFTVIRLKGWEEALDFFSWKGKGLFLDFVELKDREEPGKKEWHRLITAVVVGILSCLAFFAAYVNQHEKDIRDLDKEVSLLKRTAHRSSTIAQRIQGLSGKIRTIRQLTSEKPMMLSAIKSLADSTPNMVRLNSIAVARLGTLVMAGEAKAEIYVTDFLNTLARNNELGVPRLNTMDMDSDSGNVRFSIEVDVLRWLVFFMREGS